MSKDKSGELFKEMSRHKRACVEQDRLEAPIPCGQLHPEHLQTHHAVTLQRGDRKFGPGDMRVRAVGPLRVSHHPRPPHPPPPPPPPLHLWHHRQRKTFPQLARALAACVGERRILAPIFMLTLTCHKKRIKTKRKAIVWRRSRAEPIPNRCGCTWSGVTP